MCVLILNQAQLNIKSRKTQGIAGYLLNSIHIQTKKGIGIGIATANGEEDGLRAKIDML